MTAEEISLHLDVTQKDVVNEVVGSIVEEQGHLDILINNASIEDRKSVV